jgi:hypothetical protein
MKRQIFLFLLLITALFAGCSSAGSSRAANIKLLYYVKNNLQNTETSAGVNNRKLILKHKNSLQNRVSNKEYNITTAEAEKLYAYLKDINFYTLTPPNPEMITDAPEEYITARYDDTSNKYDMTARKNIPAQVTGLRSMIISLIEKYDSNWKQEAGL